MSDPLREAAETAEFGGSLASVQAPETMGEACSALAARLERLFALGGPADALSVAGVLRHFGEHWTDAIAGQVMALATSTEQTSTPDAPIHRHAPDALCVPSWCPVGAAEAARKQERERLAAGVTLTQPHEPYISGGPDRNYPEWHLACLTCEWTERTGTSWLQHIDVTLTQPQPGWAACPTGYVPEDHAAGLCRCLTQHAHDSWTSWLIERGQPEGHTPPVYFDNDHTAPGWSPDPWRAYQAPDKRDAEQIIAGWSEVGKPILPCRPVEHGFTCAHEQARCEWACNDCRQTRLSDSPHREYAALAPGARAALRATPETASPDAKSTASDAQVSREAHLADRLTPSSTPTPEADL